MIRFLSALATLFLLCLPSNAEDLGNDPRELQRTYEAALVYVPDEVHGARRIGIGSLGDYLAARDGQKLVLYMHGCTGIISIAHDAGRMYANAGYIFVAPDSFAREDKPVSCRADPPEGGLHRAVLGWRQAELDHARAQLSALPGMDGAQMVLAGHSEGAVTTATYDGHGFAARVIEGWTCNAGWPEYIGLNAPSTTPVLSLVGKRDPWFRLPVLRGDCGEFMDGNDQSLVFGRDDPLYKQHWLSKEPRVQKIILDFLAANL
ncbi:hypothetical protein G5B38_07685 [Pseudohalocynthiibacter aestuariivivens]|nr:hypothetical protein [Pseudohalocynthiibacter aestuariivivens]QIE45409.1 hypothetical protein G5B38_07685 [Pseudohalocynthiibacter aestuariivivens]